MPTTTFQISSCAALVFAIAALDARPAHADIDIERADRLFAEALQLREKNLEQACAKFRESLALNPQAIGTLLNVALCDERQGRTASAVAKFSEARDRAKEQKLPDYIAAAQEHIDKLVPELPYLTIRFAEPLAGMKLVIDEEVVPVDRVDKRPVDPGERKITVSAPGRLSVEKTVRVEARQHETIEIPALQKSVTVNRVVKSSRRTIGKITAISGVGVAGIGVVLGLVARNKWNAQIDSGACTESSLGDLRCTAAGQDATNRARTLGNVGTVVGIAGVAAAGVGVALWLTAPKSAIETKVGTLVPQIDGDSVGIATVGRF